MQIIVAVDSNWAIGHNNQLLARIPEDLKRFRDITIGNVVILGRKTLEEFPNGLPLKNRTNIILSHNSDFQGKDAIVVSSKEELCNTLKDYDSDQIYVIGGESIYHMLLDYCDTAYVTKIANQYEADKYFPNLDEKPNWELIEKGEDRIYMNLTYCFCRYQNKKPKPLS